MKQKLLLALSLCLMGGSAFAQPQSASEPQLLIKSSVGLMAPVWSPNGDKIAVTTDNYTGILVANADGSELMPITNAPGAGYKMVWNNDGSQILGRTNIVENTRVFHEVKTWNVNSGKETTLVEKTRGLKGTPTWASATSVVVTDRAGVKAVNTKSLVATTVSTNVFETMVNDPAGAAAKIPSLNAYAGKVIINPALSPNGKKVAFQIPGKGIFVCDNDGNNLVSLTSGVQPAWLPDSESIIFARISDNGDIYTAADLFSININSRNEYLLTSNTTLIPMRPAVSPDGKKVAFENASDASIYVINLKY